MTALALTPQPATGAIALAVTAAPDFGSPVSTNTFEATTESYTPEGTGVTVTRTTGAAPAGAWYLAVTGPGSGGTPATLPRRVNKTLTGLTSGHRYRVSAYVRVNNIVSYATRLTVTTGAGTVRAVTSHEAGSWVSDTLEFTADATTATLRIDGLDVVPVATWSVDVDQVVVQRIPTVPTTITRTDRNGVGPVRLQPDQEPIAGVLGVVDYEPALSGVVRYDLVDSSGTVTASTTLAGLVAAGPRLHVPVLPAVRSDPEMLLVGAGDARASSHVEHQVIGRADPLVTLGPLRSRRGRVQLLHPTEAAALATRAVYADGRVVMLRTPNRTSTDLYHVAVGDVAVEADGRRWRVDLDYLEVAVPSGPLLGDVLWTYATTRAGFPTYAALRARFASYTALRVGP